MGFGGEINWGDRARWSTDDVLKTLYGMGDDVNFDHPDLPGDKNSKVAGFFRAYQKSTAVGEATAIGPKTNAELPDVAVGILKGATTNSPYKDLRSIGGGIGAAARWASGLPASKPELSPAQAAALPNIIRSSGADGKIPPTVLNTAVGQAVQSISGPQAASRTLVFERSMSPNDAAKTLVVAGVIPREKMEMVAKEILRIIQQSSIAKDWKK
jgi:hypothetical protein